MKKKLVLVSVAVALVAIIITGTTLAYFTSESEEKTNTFTVGKGVDIDIDEGDEWDPDEPHPLVPGTRYGKAPTVTNTGDVDCYVRFIVTVTQSDKIDQIVANYVARKQAADPSFKFDVTSMLENFTASDWAITVDTSDSTKTVYTCVYKTEALEAGEEVSLFTAITFPADLDSADFLDTNGDPIEVGTDGKFDIIVQGQAIQATDDFTDAVDAFDKGWE